MSTLEQQLAALTTMPSVQLRDEWRKVVGAPVPRISPSLMRLALAWEIQARALGGLSRVTTQALEQAGRGLTRTSPVSAGMRLVREWNGRVHVVTIGKDQVTPRPSSQRTGRVSVNGCALRHPACSPAKWWTPRASR